MKKTITKSIGLPLKRSVIMLLLTCLSVATVYAQESQISGQVLDETGAGLPGATVMEIGSNNGTTTDLDGNFNMSVEGQNSQISISFIGYETKTLTVGSRTQFSVDMQVDAQSLEEVIVVGYGEKTKATLTGAVEQVTAATFEDRAVTNPALSLQGQTPGLVVTRGSSRPGNEGITMQIRGATSINGGDPLCIIDGVPVVGLREFYNMNPDDIESVSLLKDASASIYGSRAANGVILVTTKKGSGGMTVDYSNNFRLNTIGIRPPTPGMEEYASMFIEAVEQDGTNDYWGWSTLENMQGMANGEARIYPGTAWGDIYLESSDRFNDFYGDSFSQQHNLSISGGDEKTKYRVSGGFADNRAPLKIAYDGQKQYNVRFNFEHKLSDRVTFQSGMTYQQTNSSSPSGGIQGGVYNDPPVFPAKNPYGQWYANFNVGGRNSVGQVVDGGTKDIKEDLTKVNLGLNVNIIEGLDFKVLGSINRRIGRTDEVYLSVPLYTWAGDQIGMVNSSSSIKNTYNDATYQNYGGFLHYDKTIAEDHYVSAMVGVTADLNEHRDLMGKRTGLEDQGVYDLDVAAKDLMENEGGAGHWGLYSYVGRFNYEYQGKYLLELIGRRDGSSRFADGFKWANYGGASLGWVLTEEAFLRDNPVLSFWKLKASYGEMGNQVGIGENDYVSTISTGSIPFGSTPAIQNTARVSGITTNVRTWERVKMTNFGTEFTLLNHKLNGSFDYYIKENEGMLSTPVLSAILGGNAPKTNIGTLETKGWEAVLGYKDRIGDFNFGVSVNMGNSTNELVKLEGSDSYNAGKVAQREGYPLNSYFMYQTDGLFADQAAVDAYYAQYTATSQGEVPVQNNAAQALRPGDIIKVDADGNGYISAISDEGGDVKYMGDAAPHYNYGINTNMSWKGFDFTANFQGVLNQNIQRTGHMSYPFRAIWSTSTTSYQGLTWSETNTGADYPRLTTNGTRSGYNWLNNDFALQNNRYIRLKTLVVGYTLPSSVLEKIKLRKARVYFSGNDLWEATSIKDGYDPEMGETGSDIYPFTRTYSLGLDITF
ncbi:hypothetical protein BFP72_05450 [Reichenbachiella sp. 5M10]|uniref:SusC/RagA family TonB-linked outer membrane protein n=1 Tax=Reichenbachiella sp. 5M10 TaxID=1889772 RepID=UPI000C1562FB|nr:TonB-dependent receptor [Reichenbachiella sp. 5M10]PIB34882.1 hypothetical protein BFP72_05450 [Reichenbachiella sp. 5M10]